MIDSHAHVSFVQFDDDRDEIIARARAAGVNGWLEIGTDLLQSKQAIDLAGQHDNVWASVGVHPSDIAGLGDSDWQEMDLLLKSEKVVAVGEVGFDFHHLPKAGKDVSNLDSVLENMLKQQRSVLYKFAELAAGCNLPMIFHVRDGNGVNAHDELIAWLASFADQDRPRGVIHTFSGTFLQAEEYLKLGMYLSFSGVVTFKNSGEIASVAEEMPLERMLIETDCPFLAPDPYRGKRNEPAYVSLVAKKIAALRGMTVEEIDRLTTNNTKDLFKFSK